MAKQLGGYRQRGVLGREGRGQRCHQTRPKGLDSGLGRNLCSRRAWEAERECHGAWQPAGKKGKEALSKTMSEPKAEPAPGRPDRLR